MSTILTLKSVRELLDCKFFIPEYQRGYRWTRQQVKDLLDDLLAFTQKNNKEEAEFYCLQPLVVKKMTGAEMDKWGLEYNDASDDAWYEVIDGQQRLTTIFLLLWSKEDTLKSNNKQTDRYSLKYSRNLNLEAVLNDYIKSNGALDDSKIDNYHITNTLNDIKTWFQDNIENDTSDMLVRLLAFSPVAEDDIDDDDDDDDDYGSGDRDTESKVTDTAHNVRFIWYESDEEDPVKIFTRLNIGKISLTNSELIKALLLNSSNFGTKEERKQNNFKLRQQEIASQWDQIEITFHKDEFWSFLHQARTKAPTRIDMIFDLIVNDNRLGLEEKKLRGIGNDRYRTFRYFYEYFASLSKKNLSEKKKIERVVRFWNIVKSYFHTFREWYDDIELFHYVGYIIQCNIHLREGKSSVKVDIPYLISEWNNSPTKKDFKEKLKSLIKKELAKCPLDTQFPDNGDGKTKARPVLLFHNIQTAINQNKVGRGGFNSSYYRFPFYLYQSENWDVEHINSNTTNDESDEKTRKEWLINIFLGVNDEIKELIRSYFEVGITREEKDSLYEKIKSAFSDENPTSGEEWTPVEKNRIWNFALLDAHTNREYKNAIFSAKRRILIGKEKGEALKLPEISRDGTVSLPENGEMQQAGSCFVPLCTKHVFLKYYSPSSDVNNYWTKEVDAPKYIEDIQNRINDLDNKD